MIKRHDANPVIVINKGKSAKKGKTGCHRQYRWLCKSLCGENHGGFLIVGKRLCVYMTRNGCVDFDKAITEAGGTFWVPFGLDKPLPCLLLNQ